MNFQNLFCLFKTRKIKALSSHGILAQCSLCGKHWLGAHDSPFLTLGFVFAKFWSELCPSYRTPSTAYPQVRAKGPAPLISFLWQSAGHSQTLFQSDPIGQFSLLAQIPLQRFCPSLPASLPYKRKPYFLFGFEMLTDLVLGVVPSCSNSPPSPTIVIALFHPTQ